MSTYIDADRLEKDGWNMHRLRPKTSSTMVYETKKPTDFPAADVQEVRHGRWTTERTMEHDGETYCDQCGWTWENLTFDRTKVKKSPYCPNCGAKMDGEE